MSNTVRTIVAVVAFACACHSGSAGSGSTAEPDASHASADASPDAPPPKPSTAASCTDGVAGTWQDITPPAVATVLAAENLAPDASEPTNNGSWGIPIVITDPSTPSTLYAPADGQGIFKSTDCGGTWARVDDPADNFAERTGAVAAWAFVIDPTDTQTMYANDGYGVLGVYKSSDGGQTFTQTFTGNLVGPGMGAGTPVSSVFVDGGFVGTIRLDPTDHLHVLVSPHHSCNAPFPQFCLLESFDGAATWTVVSTNIDVADADGPWADLIDATHFYVSGTPPGGLYESTDGGATWGLASGISQTVYNWVYRSPVSGNYLLPSGSGVMQSADGESWTTLAGTPTEIDGGSLVGDHTTLYATYAFPGFTTAFYTAPAGDPTTWTTLVGPSGPIGFASLVDEPVNHFLYVSATYGGLWRYATP